MDENIFKIWKHAALHRHVFLKILTLSRLYATVQLVNHIQMLFVIILSTAEL